MSFIDWIIEAADEVIDAFFIQSDLVDVNLTDAEKVESAFYDAMANSTRLDEDDPRPMGKRVY